MNVTKFGKQRLAAVQFMLTEQQVLRLDEESVQRSMSRSTLLRQILAEAFQKWEGQRQEVA